MTCLCTSKSDRELITTVDSALLLCPVTELASWEDIKEEMLLSNVLQRDNVLFARRLHPSLETSARLSDQKVFIYFL